MYLTQTLHRALRECPNTLAVIGGGERHTFAQFIGRVQRLAGVFQRLGLQRGGRIGMMALNSVRYVEFLNATWWAGGAVNPVNIRWSPREVAYSLDDCDTRILLVDATYAAQVPALKPLSKSLQTVVYVGDGPAPAGTVSLAELMEGAQPVPDAMAGGDELAGVLYTGGTTGSPKGVMLSHGNFYLGAVGSMAAVARPTGGVTTVISPMFHVAGCALSQQVMRRLSTQILLPAFDEVSLLSCIQAERVTETFLVPTMVKRLIEHPRFAEFDISSLKFLFYGASAIDEVLLAQAMEALPGVSFIQAYGMTELSPTISILPPADHLPGPKQAQRLRSAGRSVPIAEIRIEGPDGQELPRGQIGEICARGPMVMRGYWNKPEATAQAIRDGWMHTGDGGYMDDDGYIYVVDRIKDMIVSGGENVYSAEVENALAQHPAVSMSAVIGVPDDKWGERVHAAVVLRPGMAATEAELIAHCKALIAGYKCPRSIEFRTELPLSPAGKLQKFVLREPFWAGRNRRVN